MVEIALAAHLALEALLPINLLLVLQYRRGSFLTQTWRHNLDLLYLHGVEAQRRRRIWFSLVASQRGLMVVAEADLGSQRAEIG